MKLGERLIPEKLRAAWLNDVRELRDRVDELENSLLSVGSYGPEGCECPACQRGERGHDAWVAAFEERSRDGMLTVYDHKGRYRGCIGAASWDLLLAEGDAQI